MDMDRKLDYVFFTVRDLARKVFATIVNDLTEMLTKSCPENTRICIVHFDHNDEDRIGDTAIIREQVQLEYTKLKPDSDHTTIQTCVAAGLMESLTEDDRWYITVDIPSCNMHLEYEFWIEKDETDTFDEATAYEFKGSYHGNSMPSDMTEYEGYKFYKKFVNESIQKIVGCAHVAVRTDPDDPDAFSYR